MSRSVSSPARGEDSARCVDTYDQRNLQAKAMRRWEKQQRVWATVQENIRSRVAASGNVKGACMNMSQGVYQARRREEEVGLISNATPSAVFTGFYTWESTLRATNDEGAVRYLKVGTTNFPYALYGKVTDKRRRDMNHLANTRIVFPGEKDLEATALQEPRSGMTPISFRGDKYYKKKLHKVMPLIERRMSHFMLPRAYLEVCGQMPPWTTSPEDAAAAKKSAPAVLHVPPPPPQPASLSPATAAPQQTSGKTSPLTSAKDAGQRTVSFDGLTAMGDDNAAARPSLEISTTRVLFFAQPGELAHGSVIIKNTGTTTVYYSWAPHQPITELDGSNNYKCDEDEDHEIDDVADHDVAYGAGLGGGDENFDAAGGMDDTSHEDVVPLAGNGQNKRQQEDKECSLQQRKETRAKGPSLRSLAEKSAQSKSFFYLSAPVDGVILPGDDAVFSFSVRAPFPGRFTQCYELLMIPVVSSHVIVELCAMVRNSGPSLETLSQPVADALEARAIADAQRRVVNALATHNTAYEAVEIARATQDCIAAARAAEEAQNALVEKWRKAWQETSYAALRIPFNRAVYERLDALHRNLAQTMSALGHPLHHAEWDGSVQTLWANLCGLRDAPCRNTLREALSILLRAAQVSEKDGEPLDTLLRRVAGAVALSTLAQGVGELDDTVSVAVGLRAPQLPLSPPTPRGGSLGVSVVSTTAGGGRKGGGAGAAGGGSKAHGKSTGKAKGAGGAALDMTVGRGAAAAHAEEQSVLADSIGGVDPFMEAALKEEYNARLFAGTRRIVGDAVELMCATWDGVRGTLEAACGLPLLDVTARVRAQDVRVIQDADDLEVDFAVDVIPVKKKK
ncbi:hypothetical protein DQ04_09711000 [Trypanosoma grayi]|uniref:hypothetical protein n=1 Tax=Trypanosoma grayi TaxID=71804 RepID=UPI0004F44A65|nr:hypothetical protein DQ04_09711000 [Trypanosoma grayi]KEG07467.1 hypothetical protein DQ04_09711000 [Trypanosoma grayi]